MMVWCVALGLLQDLAKRALAGRVCHLRLDLRGSRCSGWSVVRVLIACLVPGMNLSHARDHGRLGARPGRVAVSQWTPWRLFEVSVLSGASGGEDDPCTPGTFTLAPICDVPTHPWLTWHDYLSDDKRALYQLRGVLKWTVRPPNGAVVIFVKWTCQLLLL